MHIDPAILPVRLPSLQFPSPLYHHRPADQQEADDLSQLRLRSVARRPTAWRRDTVILRRSRKHASVGKDCLQKPVASTLGARLAEGKKNRRLANKRLSLTAQVRCQRSLNTEPSPTAQEILRTRARGQRSLYRGGGIRTNDPQVREVDAGDGDESNQAGER